MKVSSVQKARIFTSMCEFSLSVNGLYSIDNNIFVSGVEGGEGSEGNMYPPILTKVL